MQPFNLTIGQGDSCQLYTVLPEASHYVILYDGQIIGAIAEKKGAWAEVPLSEVHTLDLEIRSSGLHQQGSILPLPVEEIGKAISLILAGLPESAPDDPC